MNKLTFIADTGENSPNIVRYFYVPGAQTSEINDAFYFPVQRCLEEVTIRRPQKVCFFSEPITEGVTPVVITNLNLPAVVLYYNHRNNPRIAIVSKDDIETIQRIIQNNHLY